MYVGQSGQGAQLSIGEMDNQLGRFAFVRQYCEDNAPHPTKLREFNCLWTRRGAQGIWVTGRPQNEGHEPSVLYDLSVPPRFESVRYVAPLLTAHTPGALNRLLGARLSPNPIECAVHDCEQPSCSPNDDRTSVSSTAHKMAHKMTAGARSHWAAESCWQPSTSN